MRNIVKLTGALLIVATAAFFGCKEKEIDPPNSVDPIEITFEDFISGKFVDQTVLIKDVFFVIDKADSVGHLFNGTTSNGAGTRILSNCDGGTIDVFTSSDRDFAYMEVPTGMGTIYGVASEYQGAKQLLLRTIEDVAELTKDKCEQTFPTFTIAEILAGDVEEGATIKVENVEFSNTSDTWGGPRTIKDCDGNELMSYVASSASFANNTVPLGNGPLYGVIELFNTTWEIKPRTEEDGAGMANPLCGGGGGGSTICDDLGNGIYLIKDFEDDDINSCGWTNQMTVGTADWFTGSFTGAFFGKISNYNGSANEAAESWLISPAVDLSSSLAPMLSFTNANGPYPGDSLTLMISTDFDGTSDPSTATWTDLTPQATWDTDYGTWADPFIASGNIDLASYKTSSVYIAFMYIGTNSDGATWELDDITIKE